MKLIAYHRVSTAKQGASGLGIEAQRASVLAYARQTGGEVVEEFTEVESGAVNWRPQLGAALASCRLRRATLVIAKLDRLSRDAHFLLGLQAELAKAGRPFVAADMPEANELTIGVMAVVAQAERKMISTRTKAALAAAKARGVKLGTTIAQNRNEAAGAIGRIHSAAARTQMAAGRAADLAPIMRELREGGGSLRSMALALNERGICAPRGGAWSPAQIQRVIARFDTQHGSRFIA